MGTGNTNIEDLVTTLADAANAVSEAIAANEHAKPDRLSYYGNGNNDKFIESIGFYALRKGTLEIMHKMLIEMGTLAAKSD